MKRIILIYLLTIPSFCFGQSDINIRNNYDKKYDNISTSFIGGRYEIIESDIIRRNTFKVDKYNGIVYELVLNSDSVETWNKIERDKSIKDNQIQNHINYQLFMGGKMARDTYLINVNTGVTWQLVKCKDETLYFEYFE